MWFKKDIFVLYRKHGCIRFYSDKYFILTFNVLISLRMIGYGMQKLFIWRIGHLSVFEPTNASTPLLSKWYVAFVRS